MDLTSPIVRVSDERMHIRVRKTLRTVSRYLAALVGCYRTCDRGLLENLPAFGAGRQLHMFVLDSRAIISELDALAADGVPATRATRELVVVLRSYLAGLEGVLVIEPPRFRLAPRQLDLRCFEFLPEVEAFAKRIEALMAAG
jgi:hypothetical protein